MNKRKVEVFLSCLFIYIQIVVCAVFLLFSSQTTYGSTFYVDPVFGDNRSDGLSPTTPLRTLALRRVYISNNDRIFLRKGKLWEKHSLKSYPNYSRDRNYKINNNFGTNGEGSDKIDSIILGSEVVTGWTQFAPDVWQSALSVKPTRVISNGIWLAESFLDLDNDSLVDLVDGEWLWESNILYIRDVEGNPDETGKTINAVIKNGGWSVTSGDFNGDGISDIVAADEIFDGLDFNSGEIYVYYGNNEISVMPDQTISDPDGNEQDQFGFYVSSAGDINNDGFDDLIVGTNWGVNKVYLYLGSPLGLSDKPDKTLLPPNGFPAFGFGHRIALRSGDINSDGFDDILIGGGDGPQYFALFLGSSLGVSETPDKVVSFTGASSFVDVSFVGDINNDGFDDIAVNPRKIGPTNSTDIYIFYGSSKGVDENSSDVVTIDIGWTHPFGVAIRVAPARDVNGDGIDDLFVGDEWALGDFQAEGKAYIFYGSTQGISLSPDVTIDNPEPQFNVRFGASIDSIKDFNSDGVNDVIVGCPFGFFASVYNGPSETTIKTPYLTFRGPFAWSVSHAGDVKGNGQNFIILGEEFFGAYLFVLKKADRVVVNDHVFYNPIISTFTFSRDTTGCPESFIGVFSFDAELVNTSNKLLSDLAVQVDTLTGGNLLKNADEEIGEKGALLTIPFTEDYSDGQFSPGEHVIVHFDICLNEAKAFRFVTNVLGIVE